jgi:hypothetical protein
MGAPGHMAERPLCHPSNWLRFATSEAAGERADEPQHRIGAEASGAGLQRCRVGPGRLPCPPPEPTCFTCFSAFPSVPDRARASRTEHFPRKISSLSSRRRVFPHGRNTCKTRGKQAPNKNQTRADQVVLRVANRACWIRHMSRKTADAETVGTASAPEPLLWRGNLDPGWTTAGSRSLLAQRGGPLTTTRTPTAC